MSEQGMTTGELAPVPGLASERTTLAWTRSGLAVLAAVGIMARRSQPWAGGWSIVAVVLLVAGAATWASGMLLGRRSRLHQPTGAMVAGVCGLLTAGTVLLAAAGLVLALAVSP